MNTGTFIIDPAQSDWTTVGSAELSIGFLGELVAQITILAPDGEQYSEYWLRADIVDQRIEYLYYSEIEAPSFEMVRGQSKILKTLRGDPMTKGRCWLPSLRWLASPMVQRSPNWPLGRNSIRSAR